MWIGLGRLVLDYYGNQSLSDKKNNIESMCKDFRRKFNLSMLEVADFDELERCVVGFAAVMPETWREEKARDFIAKMVEEIDRAAFARVTVEDWDIHSYKEV